MSYHIIVAQERRSPVETPLGIDTSRLAIDSDGQLHSCTENMPVKWVPNIIPNPQEKPADWDDPPADWDEERSGKWEQVPWQDTIDAGHTEFSVENPQFVGVFEWDLRSPYVILHKGTYVPHFAGWPDLTKEQYDALPAAA